MHPPKNGAVENTSAADWTIDFDQFEKAITSKTKMVVLNTPRKPDLVKRIALRYR